MIKPKLNNLLLISGSGRNIGKTTLACSIIEQLSDSNDVIGIKISPHMHDGKSVKELLNYSGDARIFIESDSESNKDSSRMFRSGAIKVFYIESDDNYLLDAINYLVKLLDDKSVIICESGALAYYFKPGFHVLIKDENADISKPSFKRNLELSDITITPDDVFMPDGIKVNYQEGEWIFDRL